MSTSLLDSSSRPASPTAPNGKRLFEDKFDDDSTSGDDGAMTYLENPAFVCNAAHFASNYFHFSTPAEADSVPTSSSSLFQVDEMIDSTSKRQRNVFENQVQVQTLPIPLASQRRGKDCSGYFVGICDFEKGNRGVEDGPIGFIESSASSGRAVYDKRIDQQGSQTSSSKKPSVVPFRQTAVPIALQSSNCKIIDFGCQSLGACTLVEVKKESRQKTFRSENSMNFSSIDSQDTPTQEDRYHRRADEQQLAACREEFFAPPVAADTNLKMAHRSSSLLLLSKKSSTSTSISSSLARQVGRGPLGRRLLARLPSDEVDSLEVPEKRRSPSCSKGLLYEHASHSPLTIINNPASLPVCKSLSGVKTTLPQNNTVVSLALATPYSSNQQIITKKTKSSGLRLDTLAAAAVTSLSSLSGILGGGSPLLYIVPPTVSTKGLKPSAYHATNKDSSPVVAPPPTVSWVSELIISKPSIPLGQVIQQPSLNQLASDDPILLKVPSNSNRARSSEVETSPLPCPRQALDGENPSFVFSGTPEAEIVREESQNSLLIRSQCKAMPKNDLTSSRAKWLKRRELHLARQYRLSLASDSHGYTTLHWASSYSRWGWTSAAVAAREMPAQMAAAIEDRRVLVDAMTVDGNADTALFLAISTNLNNRSYLYQRSSLSNRLPTRGSIEPDRHFNNSNVDDKNSSSHVTLSDSSTPEQQSCMLQRDYTTNYYFPNGLRAAVAYYDGRHLNTNDKENRLCTGPSQTSSSSSCVMSSDSMLLLPPPTLPPSLYPHTISAIQFLLAKGANAHIEWDRSRFRHALFSQVGRDGMGATIMCSNDELDDLELVSSSLQISVSPPSTPLLWILRHLFDIGAVDPNSSDELGLFPLHYACYYTNLPAIALLLGEGAKVDAISDVSRWEKSDKISSQKQNVPSGASSFIHPQHQDTADNALFSERATHLVGEVSAKLPLFAGRTPMDFVHPSDRPAVLRIMLPYYTYQL